MKNKLAIIIPAYKARFLRETLDSILKQNSSEFIVYVGDDASPENIEGLVHDYDEKLDIVYHRFSTNLGGVDLGSGIDVLLYPMSRWFGFFLMMI